MQAPFNRAMPLSGPALDIVPVVPSDGSLLGEPAIGLYCEVGGDVVIDTITGTQRTVAVADMSILPVGVTRVYATGTTATGLHAMVLR